MSLTGLHPDSYQHCPKNFIVIERKSAASGIINDFVYKLAVECRYNTVRYNTTLHTPLYWLTQNMNQTLDSQKTLHGSTVGGELWSVYCEDFGEKWPRYNGIALYFSRHWVILFSPQEYFMRCTGLEISFANSILHDNMHSVSTFSILKPSFQVHGVRVDGCPILKIKHVIFRMKIPILLRQAVLH